MNKAIIWIVVIVVVAAAIWYFVAGRDEAETPANTDNTEQPAQ